MGVEDVAQGEGQFEVGTETADGSGIHQEVVGVLMLILLVMIVFTRQ